MALSGSGWLLAVPERGWIYVMHDVKASASKAEALRNCLWTGVFQGLCPPPIVTPRHGMNTEGERLQIESVPRSSKATYHFRGQLNTKNCLEERN